MNDIEDLLDEGLASDGCSFGSEWTMPSMLIDVV